MKRIIKIAGFILGGLAGIFSILLILIITGLFNPIINQIITKNIENVIEGELKISKLEGNIFSDFVLKDIEIIQEDRALIQIAEIKINYRLIPILNNEIHVDTIKISHIKSYLEKDEDNNWNIEKLVENTSENNDTTKKSDWNIQLKHIQLESVEAFVKSAQDSAVPEYISLNALFDFSSDKDELTVNLSKFNLVTKNPEFEIKTLAFKMQQSEQEINWQNFILELPNTVINSNGSVPFDSLLNSQINLTASPFNFGDIKAWIPDIHGNPDIKITSQNSNGKNHINFKVDVPGQKLEVNGVVSGTTEFPEYELDIKVDSINGEYWFQNQELHSLITGELKLKGKGIDFRNNNVNVLANFKNIFYEGIEFSGLEFSLDKNGGDISGNIKAGTYLGNLTSKVKINDLFGYIKYDINANLNHFDLSKIAGDKRLKSDINFGIKAKGEGTDISTLTTDIQLFSKNSILFEQPVSDFNTRIALRNGNYNLQRLKFETPYLQFSVNGNGNVSSRNNLAFNISLRNTEEISTLLFRNNVDLMANVNGSISGPSDNLILESNLELTNFTADSIQINDATAKVESRIIGQKLTWKNISTDLLTYQESLSQEKLFIKGEAQIGKAAYKNYSLSDFSLNFEKNNDVLDGIFSTQFLNGNVHSVFKLSKLFSETEYSIHTDFAHLNIYELAKDSQLWSELNFQTELIGKGTSPETVKANLNLQSIGSTFQGMQVSDFNSEVAYTNGWYELSDFSIETPMVLVNINALGNLNENTNISYSLKTKNFNDYIRNFDIKNLELEGEIEGSIRGKLDSLQFKTISQFEKLKYDTIQADKIVGETDIWLIDSLFSGKINLLSENFKIQELTIKEIIFNSEIEKNTANSMFHFYVSDSLQGSVHTILKQNQNPIIYFPEIDLNLYNSRWQSSTDTSSVILGRDSIQVNNFVLQSAESFIKANGIFSFHGNEDLQIEISNLNLMSIPGLQPLPYTFSGLINANISLTGTAKFPVFKGIIDIDSPTISDIELNKFYTEINYEAKNLELNSYINDQSKRLVTVNAEIPIDFSFTTDIDSIIKTTPVFAQFKLNELEINQLNRFIPLKGTDIKGTINLDVTLSNTIDSLLIDGGIQLLNGKIDFDKYGIYYQDINLVSRFNNHSFNLDSLHINSGNGNLTLKGDAAISSYTQFPENFNLQMEGNNFRAFNSELIKAIIDTRINISGTPDNPVFNGNMKINRSTFNTDIFLREYNRVYNTSEEPLLVQAQTKNISIQPKNVKKDSLQKSPPNIYKNLRGEYDIQIPGNTWIKGKDMNFEISGNLKILKEREQIDLFGNMNVKRGFYEIYGKKLDFEEGEIIFTGGQSINPNINFVIGYKFRDPEKTLRKLNINIKGQVSQPELSFTLDDTEIEEKDAISYLVFNKSLAQLDTRENSTVAGSNLDIAKDLALVQVTNLVKNALQSTIGLDVIEITGASGGTEGSVSIGKYITNNLYLNYERNFALDKKNKLIEPEKISLEYQILRSLFLQATNQKTNSGFDFIFKWTWK